MDDEKLLLEIRRSYLDNCTIGKWLVNGALLVRTVERPYLSNQKWSSCIPPGEYDLIFMEAHKVFGDCWYLENKDLGVTLMGPSTRTEIFVHIFNFPHEGQGCIGPGLKEHPQKWGVSQSRKAMDLLRKTLGTGNHKLKIV